MAKSATEGVEHLSQHNLSTEYDGDGGNITY